MSLSPEIEAAITARVAVMDHQERYDRSISMTGSSEEDDLEFAKLMLGPQATMQDFVDLMDDLVRADPPPETR